MPAVAQNTVTVADLTLRTPNLVTLYSRRASLPDDVKAAETAATAARSTLDAAKAALTDVKVSKTIGRATAAEVAAAHEAVDKAAEAVEETQSNLEVLVASADRLDEVIQQEQEARKAELAPGARALHLAGLQRMQNAVAELEAATIDLLPLANGLEEVFGDLLMTVGTLTDPASGKSTTHHLGHVKLDRRLASMCPFAVNAMVYFQRNDQAAKLLLVMKKLLSESVAAVHRADKQ